MIDMTPGGLDGPPKREGRVAFFAGLLIGMTSVALVFVAMAWAIAWMITNFPGA